MQPLYNLPTPHQRTEHFYYQNRRGTFDVTAQARPYRYLCLFAQQPISVPNFGHRIDVRWTSPAAVWRVRAVSAKTLSGPYYLPERQQNDWRPNSGTNLNPPPLVAALPTVPPPYSGPITGLTSSRKAWLGSAATGPSELSAVPIWP